MIFLTVGTTHPFDRLALVVDRAIALHLITEPVCAQLGSSVYHPQHYAAVATLDKPSFDARLREAAAIISHAGMGIMTQALQAGKPLLAMPRLARFGEVVNDHQVALAETFARAGHILIAHDEEEFCVQVGRLRDFVPTERNPQRDRLIQRVCAFLERNGACPEPTQVLERVR